jgi:hydroxymethylbilane synthase
MTQFKIGTRGSLLARTQATLVKNELEQKTGHQFELVFIKTLGDQIVDKPLWQIDGKDFFTKELDDALLAGQVDLVIHSFKDLSTQRPAEFEIASIPKRQLPHDILLMKKETAKDLINHQGNFVVGTSSPRRIQNLGSDLKNIIPLNHSSQTSFEVLRGNVNTRIQKLLDGKYHAITLALAGLERLCLYPESVAEITPLLNQLTFVVLPLDLFPTAAAQGALAIEINKSHPKISELKKALETIDHNETRLNVNLEREIFRSYGGGCHLALGVTVKGHHEGEIVVKRGLVDGKDIFEKKFTPKNSLPNLNGKKLFVGLAKPGNYIHDELIEKKSIEAKIPENHPVLIATTHAAQSLTKQTATCLFAPGKESMKHLAGQGIFVHGMTDFSGEAEISSFQNMESLKIMEPVLKNKMVILTNAESKSSLGDIVVGYERKIKAVSDEFKSKINHCDAFFWTSYFQYQSYLKHFPNIEAKLHFCGLGKTLNEFKSNNIQVQPLLNKDQFLNLGKIL